MSHKQLCHGALVDANRRIAELERHLANVQQRAREAALGSAAALREAELMRDSHFDNLRTAYASIARLRDALTGAREFVATEAETRGSGDGGWPLANKDEYFSGPRKLLTKIDAALQAAPDRRAAPGTHHDSVLPRSWTTRPSASGQCACAPRWLQATEFLAAGMTDVVIIDPLGETYRPKILTEMLRKHTVH
jgi:hypothetical protein